MPPFLPPLPLRMNVKFTQGTAELVCECELGWFYIVNCLDGCFLTFS